jgi:pimeloyl-ACP methyl ester carboxylesterase
MKPYVLSVLLFLGNILSSYASQVEVYKAKPVEGMSRAEIYLWSPSEEVKAVLVYCPGHNGVGKGFTENKEWQKYAKLNNVALCGLSFASPMHITKQGKGYSYAAQGSGKILVDCIDEFFPKNQMPIYLYGYSAGARFTASFMAWKPDRVLSWCASGVGTWPDLPDAKVKKIPHGIVACGEYDAICYWSSLNYFQRGRKQGRAWSWVSLEKLGHGYSENLDLLVKKFLSIQLQKSPHLLKGNYYDLDTKIKLSQAQVKKFPEFAVWIVRNPNLVQLWKKMHQP